MNKNLHVLLGKEELVYLSWTRSNSAEVLARKQTLLAQGYIVSVESQYPYALNPSELVTECVLVRPATVAA